MNSKFKSLAIRTLSGIVLVILVFGAAFLGISAVLALSVLLMVIGLWEFYSLAKKCGTHPLYVVGYLMSLLPFVLIFLAQFKLSSSSEPLFVGLLLVEFLAFTLAFVIEVFHHENNPIGNIAVTLMGPLYIAVPLLILPFLPVIAIPVINESDSYWSFMIFLISLVWSNDVFAYLVGMTCGKHKMCPRLSPKKTWEGFAGGVMMSMVLSVAVCHYTGWIGLLPAAGLGLVASLSAVVGDLVESMFKRAADVKDSGNLIPGHGGILDRFDALLVAIPFIFVYLVLFQIF